MSIPVKNIYKTQQAIYADIKSGNVGGKNRNSGVYLMNRKAGTTRKVENRKSIIYRRAYTDKYPSEFLC